MSPRALRGIFVRKRMKGYTGIRKDFWKHDVIISDRRGDRGGQVHRNARLWMPNRSRVLLQ